jgi:class 3 adenylate cyclase
MDCRKCGSRNPGGKKFCGECGAARGLICPACGSSGPPGKQFCGDCGASLSGRPAPVEAIVAESGAAAPAPAATPVTARAAEAERRQLTVMFCDLVGSTALAATLDPEDLREVIRAYQDCCAGVIARFEGHIAKFMGDGVLAYFGYPYAHEDDAERAVRAGLDIVAGLAALPASAKSELAVRIGIATGLVVVGDLIGEGASQEHAVVGETPNLAARLQAIAEPNSVVISRRTRRLLAGWFELTDLGVSQLKGIAEPVRAWRVGTEGKAESRFEALRGQGLTPLVGRDHEIALLLDRFERAKDGEGQVVLLAGEAGIGKSRIVRALRERLGDEPFTPLSHYCSPYHQSSALYPVIGLLQRGAGLRQEDPAEERLAKLESLLALSTENLAEAVPLLAALLSVPVGEAWPALDLTPQRQKQRTLEVLVGQVAGLAARQPVVTVYEDAHWIDPTSLELLDLLIDRIQGLPALLVVTYRPEFTPPWTGYAHVTSLSLSRLTRRHGSAMVDRVTGGKALPAEVLQQIVAKTDGIPLFVEELTKTVLESGLLRDAGDHYELSGLQAPLAIPATLHDSLMARLDRLAPVKEVAQIGAAISPTSCSPPSRH